MDKRKAYNYLNIIFMMLGAVMVLILASVAIVGAKTGDVSQFPLILLVTLIILAGWCFISIQLKSYEEVF